MKDLHPVSYERYANKRYKPFTDHSYTAGDNLAPLVVTELPKAVHSVPIGFVKAENKFVLVAIQGLVAGQNLLIDEEGRWRGRYFPDHYHCYPFAVARVEGSDKQQHALCIDESSGLVVDAQENEEGVSRFFEDDQSPSELVAEVTEWLTDYTKKQIMTKTICECLQKHKLLKEWEVSWRENEANSNVAANDDSEANTENSSVKKVTGLYCIDQEALSGLSPESLAEVRDTGALLAAYGQMYSMNHIRALVALMRDSNDEEMVKEVSFDSMEDFGSISFDNI
jgi:hypothetical protein